MKSNNFAADLAAEKAQRDSVRRLKKTASEGKRAASRVASLLRHTSRLVRRSGAKVSRGAGSWSKAGRTVNLLVRKHKGAALGDKYAESKGVLISTSMLSLDSKQREKEWDLELRKHPAVKPERLIVHVSLSRPKGAELDSKQWAEVVRTFLFEAGAEGVAHVAYRHSDTPFDHTHLIYSRSLPTGRLLADSNDFYTMRDAAQRTAQRLGIEVEGSPTTTQAPTDAAVRALRRAQRRNTQQDVWVRPELVQDALRLARNTEEFAAVLQSKGIDFKLSQSTTNKTTGALYRVHGSESWVAGSSLNRELTLPKLQAQFELNARRANGVALQRPPTPTPGMRPALQQVPRQRGG